MPLATSTTFGRRTVSKLEIKIVEAAASPYHGIPRKSIKKAIFQLSGKKLMGAFFTYMGKSAMC